MLIKRISIIRLFDVTTLRGYFNKNFSPFEAKTRFLKSSIVYAFNKSIIKNAGVSCENLFSWEVNMRYTFNEISKPSSNFRVLRTLGNYY